MLDSFIANGMQIPSGTEERAAERACGRFAAGGAANSGTAPTKRPDRRKLRKADIRRIIMKKSKFLSILLALCLTLSLLPTAALAEDAKGTAANPYTREEFAAMTRDDYIAAQERLGGTMYVSVGDYSYSSEGVLGNGVRNDTPGQTEDRSVLNGYNSNGYLDDRNDGANGKNVVFVNGSITSGVTGYKDVDNIGTSLLLAVPAYTNVTFKDITFSNVMSFNYQLYTGPWSQLGSLNFEGCTFNGIIVGSIATQTLKFSGCTFNNYVNTMSANNSNPTWIRPAYGNWTKDDNEGQGGDFRSLTSIVFENNVVTSTRPVKFERISQWDITSTVVAAGNSFDISAQESDPADEIKNVGLYLGAEAKFNLVAENNTKSENTAAIYTIPKGEKSLPAGSTVKDKSGNDVTLPALKWKGTAEDVIQLETAYDASAVAAVNGVGYPTLQAAVDAAKRGATVKLLADTRENVTINKAMTLDLNGHTLNGGTVKGKPALTITARTVTIKDSSEAQTGTIMRGDTAENSGVSSHYVIDIQGNAWVMFESGNVKNNSGNTEGKGASLVRVGDDSVKKYPGLVINGGTFTQDNFIVIKVDRGYLTLNGGTLNSANSYAVENWFRATIKGGTVNGAVSSWTYSGGSNSTLEISGGTVNGNVESVSYDGSAGKKALVSISGGTVNGTLKAGIYNSATEPTKDMATIEVTAGTFSKDPSEYLVEGSTVTKNEDNTYGVAKAYLAKVGETSYYTMDEAFKAQTASGEPILLLRDYTTGGTFNSGSINRTVDLNGHTWTCTGTDASSAAFEINYSNNTLTVKNGRIVSSQLVGLIPSAMGGTITYDNSGLVFEGVEMSTTATSGIETNGNNTNDSVTLKNSTLNVPNGFGIYFPSSGTLTIDNSTINAKTMGVQLCAGSLSINAGSAITVSGGPVEKAENDGAIQDGAAVSIVNRAGYKGLGEISITGGTFTAKEGNDAVKAYDWNNTDKTESAFTANDNVAVSGGTYSSRIADDLCKDGFCVIANKNGTFGVVREYSDTPSTPGSNTSAVTVPKADNGTVTVTPSPAKPGETVTIVATPDAGYELGSLTVTDSKGDELALSGSGSSFTFTMPAGSVVVKATFVKRTVSFSDVSANDYFAGAVTWAVEKGITDGIGNGLFGPNQPCTRGQIVTFLWRAAGSPEPKALSSFTDVPANEYYAKAVAWAVENGITTGTSATTFSPNDTCTRGQAVTFLCRAVGAQGAYDGAFSDVTGEMYCAGSVAWAVANGVTTGVGGGKFAPDDFCTRGQIVTFLYRAYQGK